MSEVVYETERATLVCGRAEDCLPSLPKESFELILTDPPYGRDWQSNTRAETFSALHNDGAADRETIRGVLTECVRLTRQNRHLYVFGPNDVIEGLKVSEAVELVWDKATIGSGDHSKPWGPQHEPITFAVSKWRHAGRAGESVLPARLRKGSILRYPRPTGRKVRHPSEKPVPLLRELIESSSRQGDTVLDPFAGICSTGVAAILCGRRALMVESDSQWIPVGIERLERAERLADEMGLS